MNKGLKAFCVGLLAGLLGPAQLWAGATFSRATNWNDGDTLTASALNGEFNNILNNLTPAGMDDYSANTTEMRTTTDPYPGGSESLATSLQGELERIRYLLAQITGESQWYIDPDTTLATLAGNVFATGTKMPFFQASCPTGWTQDTSQNDKVFRVVSSTTSGGSAGGTTPVSSGHYHNTTAHTHTIAHTHELDELGDTAGWSGDANAPIGRDLSIGGGTDMRQLVTAGDTDVRFLQTYTKAASATDSGSHQVLMSTDTVAYTNWIICTKD